jgi:hypothetical protein
MERAIEIYAALNFFVIGLSHIFQHRAWAEFFILLHSKGRVGVFVNGFLSLSMGSLIVAFHNVWTGIPAILTVMGWCFIVKSLVAFIATGVGLRSLQMGGLDNSRKFIPAGVVMLAVAALLAYELWLR